MERGPGEMVVDGGGDGRRFGTVTLLAEKGNGPFGALPPRQAWISRPGIQMRGRGIYRGGESVLFSLFFSFFFFFFGMSISSNTTVTTA